MQTPTIPGASRMAQPTPEQLQQASEAVRKLLTTGQSKMMEDLRPYAERIQFLSDHLDRIHQTIRACIQYNNQSPELAVVLFEHLRRATDSFGALLVSYTDKLEPAQRNEKDPVQKLQTALHPDSDPS